MRRRTGRVSRASDDFFFYSSHTLIRYVRRIFEMCPRYLFEQHAFNNIRSGLRRKEKKCTNSRGGKIEKKKITSQIVFIADERVQRTNTILHLQDGRSRAPAHDYIIHIYQNKHFP